MSVQITTAFVQQYKGGFSHLAQQKMSRLRNTVRLETQAKKRDFYDQIGASAAVKKTTRHGNTPRVDTPHSRRAVDIYDYEWADLIDRNDLHKLGSDPQNPYVQGAAMAMARGIDDEIIGAFFAVANTGETGATPISFDSNNIVPHGSTGLNIDKLGVAKELLDAADVDPDEERYIAVGARQLRQLLNLTEVKSADYNTVKALAAGAIDTFMGFKFILSNRLLVDTYRLLPCWAKSGMVLAVGEDVQTEIGPRPDKGYSTQIYTCMSIGSARMEEAKVVQIPCTVS